MKNKCTCHGAAVLAALVSVLLAACASKPPVYVPSDFTDEKILELEIASIQKMAEKEPVKALWRSKLLCETVADTEELYQQMLSGVLSLFETVVSERKWTEALTVFYSLAALESAPQGWSLERLFPR